MKLNIVKAEKINGYKEGYYDALFFMSVILDMIEHEELSIFEAKLSIDNRKSMMGWVEHEANG